eukprot:2885400-Pyramimonas_sp.AAC.1
MRTVPAPYGRRASRLAGTAISQRFGWATSRWSEPTGTWRSAARCSSAASRATSRATAPPSGCARSGFASNGRRALAKIMRSPLRRWSPGWQSSRSCPRPEPRRSRRTKRPRRQNNNRRQPLPILHPRR